MVINVPGGDFFFFHFRFFPPTNFSFFQPGKKGEVAATRVAIFSATRWTGKKLFLKGGLRGEVMAVT